MADGVVYQLKPWVSIIAAGLPAVGAALGGIKFTGEFRSTALRFHRHGHARSTDLEERYDASSAGPNSRTRAGYC